MMCCLLPLVLPRDNSLPDKAIPPSAHAKSFRCVHVFSESRVISHGASTHVRLRSYDASTVEDLERL